MSKDLTLEDINDNLKGKVYDQDYSASPVIEGVQLIDLKSFPAEEGDFAELLRFTQNGEFEEILGFKIRQINSTRLFPASIKAWHLHFKQNEIWYVSNHDHLVVGLWDLRKKSKTSDMTTKIVLGYGKRQLLYIPKGIAHGSSNLINREIDLFYFVDKQFDLKNPDEKRINWDAKGKEFWTQTRD